MSRYRFGFDIGGTFTDFVLYDEVEGRVEVAKELTDVSNTGNGVVSGLRSLLSSARINPEQLAEVVCGATTLVTNLIIERKGARVAVITTKGFRDILRMRREVRYDLYDLAAKYPPPLVPASLCMEVSERIGPDGAIVQPLQTHEVERLAHELKNAEVQSVAVCLLHSYKNSAHERSIAKILTTLWPELYVSISSDIAPEIREYERMSTTVLNAFVKPFVGNYFRTLERLLKGVGVNARIHIMQSNGGIIDTAEVERVPIKLLESGPAAGAIGAAHIAEKAGYRNIISFDMGGTTAKNCLITDGEPGITFAFDAARADRFKKGSGFPVRLPVVDLIEIGAGGGSIANVGMDGLLKVGPQSSGASPGPACYALGGVEPTVTDADLVLGYLNPHYFVGGRMQLNVELARKAIEDKIALPLRLSLTEAADGVFRIVTEKMANAVKVHVAEKGKDPRNYALVAFGGAGPVHACAIAKRLGIPTVLVPLRAGVFSALGLLLAPLSIDLCEAYFHRFSDLRWDELRNTYDRMERVAIQALKAAGSRAEEVEFVRTLDMRYAGQGHDVNVLLTHLDSDGGGVVRLRDRFYQTYSELFGRHLADVEVEIVNCRVKAACPSPDVTVSGQGPTKSMDNPLKGSRKAYFSDAGGWLEVPVYEHQLLQTGTRLNGPAIVEQKESTTIIGPKESLLTDDLGNLVIAVGLDTATGEPNGHSSRL